MQSYKRLAQTVIREVRDLATGQQSGQLWDSLPVEAQAEVWGTLGRLQGTDVWADEKVEAIIEGRSLSSPLWQSVLMAQVSQSAIPKKSASVSSKRSFGPSSLLTPPYPPHPAPCPVHLAVRAPCRTCTTPHRNHSSPLLDGALTIFSLSAQPA